MAHISLMNKKNETLRLQISLLTGDKLRIKIVELNHSRYELEEALDGEPVRLQ